MVISPIARRLAISLYIQPAARLVSPPRVENGSTCALKPSVRPSGLADQSHSVGLAAFALHLHSVPSAQISLAGSRVVVLLRARPAAAIKPVHASGGGIALQPRREAAVIAVRGVGDGGRAPTSSKMAGGGAGRARRRRRWWWCGGGDRRLVR